MPTKVPTVNLDTDPLAKILEPPPDESSAERDARLLAEAQAKRISDGIDEQLERERLAEKRGPKALKVLLLGQSESGKSTTLKNFQLLYDTKAFKKEKISWKAIIQLNVVRSVHIILDAITQAQTDDQSPTSSSSSRPFELNQALLRLQMRLAPLLQVEQALTRRLAPVDYGSNDASILNRDSSYADRSKNLSKEVAIHSGTSWKGAFNKLLGGDASRSDMEHYNGNDPGDPSVVLNACAQDMALLWSDPLVKQLLRKRKLRLEELAGFFLDSLDRVTAIDYIPSDDDVLRARLKTLGVSEHRFTISASHVKGPISRVWRVFDVGGHRSLRAAWVPYFDDMDAIIFLAPISAFDQALAEDSEVNRLEDSVNIWKMIVANELLKETNLILFLNKTDILKAKLESGIKFSEYVVSYGTRPNDFDNTSVYLRKKFAGILKEKSIVPRPFYCHLTSVTNIQSTKKILTNVKDVLMRKNLSDAALLS